MAKDSKAPKQNRIAIVDSSKCKPSKCNLQCKLSCPVNKTGKQCITVTKTDTSTRISEILCIGCGACVNACPFNAIKIINLASGQGSNSSFLDEMVFRYSPNSFFLCRLPVPKIGCVTSLVGTNGIGKSTCLKILQGSIKPNLGIFSDSSSKSGNVPKIQTCDWSHVMKRFRGSELHNYFSKMLANEISSAVKEQYVDNYVKKWTDIILNNRKSQNRKINKNLSLNSNLDENNDEVTVRDVVKFYYKDNDVGVLKNDFSSENSKSRRKVVSVDNLSDLKDQRMAIKFKRPNEIESKKEDIENTNFKKDSSPDLTENMKNMNLNKKTHDSDIPILLIQKFSLTHILDRPISKLSGGELQRLAILTTCIQKASIYFFDEPSSFLDIKQRLTMAEQIRKTLTPYNYIMTVEHDLAICDLMSDYGNVMYGEPNSYGVISGSFSIKQAINVFLDGYVPNENMRFRKDALKFDVAERPDALFERNKYVYESMCKTFYNKTKVNVNDKLEEYKVNKTEGDNEVAFKLEIEGGTFSPSEITVFLGENGTGKSTFISLISNLIQPDNSSLEQKDKESEKIENTRFSSFSTSVKPQKILPKYKGTVKDLLMSKIRKNFLDATFVNEIIKPLKINTLYNTTVSNLSGGELQRLALTITLGKDADIYLIDEPSAYLDADQRLTFCKVIKRFIMNNNKIGFVVEHDLILATYLADKIVVFEGEPGKRGKAMKPMSVEEGMNTFLKGLDVTFRRDKENRRPRINKPGSSKDREQKESGKYFFA